MTFISNKNELMDAYSSLVNQYYEKVENWESLQLGEKESVFSKVEALHYEIRTAIKYDLSMLQKDEFDN